MPSARACAGPARCDRLAVPADLARVGLQQAVDDLDQRRFAGAVLAEQRMDLRRQTSMLIESLASESAIALGDMDSLQQRFVMRPDSGCKSSMT